MLFTWHTKGNPLCTVYRHLVHPYVYRQMYWNIEKKSIYTSTVRTGWTDLNSVLVSVQSVRLLFVFLCFLSGESCCWALSIYSLTVGLTVRVLKMLWWGCTLDSLLADDWDDHLIILQRASSTLTPCTPGFSRCSISCLASWECVRLHLGSFGEKWLCLSLGWFVYEVKN